MPADNGERVVTGARHLSPFLGGRMVSGHLLQKSVFIRELLPQDLKLEIEHFSQEEAMGVAEFVAHVVGRGHARQLKAEWLAELQHNRSKSLDAPSWLWNSVVDLVGAHEAAYPIEPHNFNFFSKQLKRWSHGFIQNVRLHWRHVLHQPYLSAMVLIGLWDAVIASCVSLVVLPLLAILLHPAFLLGFFLDLPAIAVPVLTKAWQRSEMGNALISLPCFLVMRFVNAVFMIRAVWLECVVMRPLLVYEKGH